MILRPHLLMFFGYNLLYFVPLLLVSKLGFAHGGVMKILNSASGTLDNVLEVYLIGFLSFCLGSLTVSLVTFRSLKKFKIQESNVILSNGSAVFIFLSVGFPYLITKILLIPLGIYSSYAFDSGSMTGGVWSFSMFMTETLVLSIFFFYYSEFQKKKLVIGLLVFLLCITLLHGTRIFILIIAFLATVYYIYESKGSFVKKITVLIMASAVVMMLFLGVFIFRSSISLESTMLSFEYFLGPIVYESVFNQIALFKAVKLNAQGLDFAGFRIFIDSFVFSFPRILIPDKGEINYLTKFGKLNPLGGMSGYAATILYMGDYYFLFYFFLGAFLSLIEFLSRYKIFSALRIVYLYFICDILFRLMRDGLVIPFKMFFNGIVILIIWFLMVSISKRLKNGLSLS